MYLLLKYLINHIFVLQKNLNTKPVDKLLSDDNFYDDSSVCVTNEVILKFN